MTRQVLQLTSAQLSLDNKTDPSTAIHPMTTTAMSSDTPVPTHATTSSSSGLTHPPTHPQQHSLAIGSNGHIHTTDTHPYPTAAALHTSTDAAAAAAAAVRKLEQLRMDADAAAAISMSSSSSSSSSSSARAYPSLAPGPGQGPGQGSNHYASQNRSSNGNGHSDNGGNGGGNGNGSGNGVGGLGDEVLRLTQELARVMVLLRHAEAGKKDADDVSRQRQSTIHTLEEEKQKLVQTTTQQQKDLVDMGNQLNDHKRSIERLQIDRDRTFALYRDSEDRVGVLEKQYETDQATIVGLQKQADRWHQKYQEIKTLAKKEKALLTQQLHQSLSQQRQQRPQSLVNGNEDEDEEEDGEGVWREVQGHDVLQRQNNVEVSR